MAAQSKRKLAILTFVTLDGVMQAPSQPEEDASRGFDRGGWARPWWDEVMADVQQEAMAEPYDLLLGRKTYDIFAPHFANAGDNGDGVTRRLNEATKYVVTNSLQSLDWSPSVVIGGDVIQRTKELKAEDGKLLQVHGSWELIQTLLASDLIDEFRLWTFPVLAGGGKCLFDGRALPSGLTLVTSGATPGGVVKTIYRRDHPAAI
ncbi:MAG: dihydrofolate reductase family protein [Geminicoccaceae bacterium]